MNDTIVVIVLEDLLVYLLAHNILTNKKLFQLQWSDVVIELLLRIINKLKNVVIFHFVALTCKN